ncbi:recombinase family protein [Xanthomonas perforans]
MIVGYSRVSTARQAAEGTSLESQLEVLTAAGAERIFTDAGVSGAKASRPQLDAMLDQLRDGDTVIVAKLDRLGRSMSHLVALVNDFKARGIAFRSLAEGIDTATPAGVMVFGIFASLAEFERERIMERTAIGREAAKAQGRTGGRPKMHNTAMIATAKKVSAADLTPREKAAAVGVSLATYYRLLKLDTEQPA